MEPGQRPDRELPEVGEVLRRRGVGGVGEGRAQGVERPSGQARPSVPPSPQDQLSHTGEPASPQASGQPPQAGRSSARRRRARMGVVPVLVTIGAVGWFAAAPVGYAEAIDDVPVNVNVQVQGAGDIRVNSVPGNVVRIHASSSRPGSCESSESTVEGGALSIELTCDRGWFGGRDVEIDVPERTALALRGGDADVRVTGRLAAAAVTTESGEVRMNDVTADMSVQTQDGDVRLDDVSGKVDVRTAGGDVRGEVLESPSVAVRSQRGDVRLEFTQAVPATTIETADDVRLELAAGSAAQTQLQSAGGDIDSSVPDTPGAPQQVSITTRGGDIRLSD